MRKTIFRFFSSIPLAIGGYLIVLVLRSRLVIDATHIGVRRAFAEKTADVSEIEGFRTIGTRNGSFWQLKLTGGRGSVSVQKSYDCDGLRAWLAQIPDLDERDRKAVLDEIEKSEEHGAMPEDRLAKLAAAKQLNFALSGLAIAAAIAFGLGGARLHLPAAMVLALLPAVLIYLVHREPLLYAILKPKRDPRTDLGIAFIVCGLGLSLGNRDGHFVEMPILLEYAALVALLCCAGIFSSARRNPQFLGAMALMLFVAGAYGWGLVATADVVLDKSAPASYTTAVQDKHESRGRSTSYYLELAPWGPLQRNDVRVSRTTYEGASIGDPVCLELRPGVLHVQWYQVVACAERTGR